MAELSLDLTAVERDLIIYALESAIKHQVISPKQHLDFKSGVEKLKKEMLSKIV